VCREHDIALSHSNNLTDRHAANKVFADKALRRERFGSEPPMLPFWAAMKVKTKIGMKLKKTTMRKKAMKKRIIPTAK